MIRASVYIASSLVLFGGCNSNSSEPKAQPFATKSPKPPTASDPSSAESKPQCNGKTCAPLPTGIKGLNFGMSVAEVKTILGSAVEWTAPEKQAVGTVNELEQLINPQLESVPLPGVSTTISTTIGASDAECRLDFEEASADSTVLVGIACDINDSRAFARIAGKLIEKHGPATASERQEIGLSGFEPKEKVTSVVWHSPHAFLSVEQLFYDKLRVARGAILENYTPNHWQLVHKAKEAAQAKRDAAKHAAARAEKERQAAEARALEDRENRLGDDLSGSAELPPAP